MSTDTCVVCGKYVPEGRMVCPACEIEHKVDRTNFRITLSNFVERFVAHNTVIYLCDSQKTKIGNKVESEIIWKGMDWQIVGTNEEYYKNHPEVKPCPYNRCNVVKIWSTETEFVDEIYIDIEVPQQKKVLKKESAYEMQI